ncbi:MAG: glycosyltransferase family 4 protein [Acidobacteriales bacterium]|nr:glycosyltransferase family 4 protein [Terriglobales bacterium]
MHILITTDTVGGVWTYTRELVAGLVRRGCRVTLVSFGDIPTPAQAEWMEGLPGLDFRPTAFRLEWMQDVEADMVASAEFLHAVTQETSPDLLHFNQFYYGALRTDLPRIVVAHSDVIGWWEGVHNHHPPETKWLRWYRHVVTEGLAAANTVVAPSRWMLDSLVRNYVAPRKTRVIWNGRSPLLFNPHITKEDYVLSVGRIWDSGKQVTLLAQQELPAPIWIVGSERHPDSALRGESLTFGASQPVVFKGPQSEAQLRQVYGRAPIYAATSRYEPFGLAPLEAALSRCAIVANDIPSFRELWEDAALFFDRNSSESLGAVLRSLISDRERRMHYANRAYNHALRRFNSQRMADDYLALYHTLVTTHAGVAA